MKLQNRIDISYDSSVAEHQEALRALWKAAFPEEELHGIGELVVFCEKFPGKWVARVINFSLKGQTRKVECSGALYFMQKSFLHKDLGIDLGSLVLSQKKCSGALFSQFLFS
ncbi:ELMO domain-containing protein C [Artemisia annua]|uniref:ELMO domain-containing protein C n=1 Tax=Artemisia annua TaxID=35608 RepID=A0A2U1L7G1_ARTAN|nr:ELMO domain-containing protein C [Artemisia annua]